jgi:hypothetical protein
MVLQTSGVIEELVGLVDVGDPFGYPPADLVALHVAAIDRRLQVQRHQMKVLDQRAQDAGVERVTALDDVVPLLFSDASYKSYPSSFVEKGQWDRLGRWLGALSTVPVTGIDLDGIEDIDDWISRMHAAGHYVMGSSGTSGKCSLLDHSATDLDLMRRVVGGRFIFDVEPRRDRSVFILTPRRGAHAGLYGMNALAEAFGPPDERHFISEGPVTMVEANRLGALRRAMAEGRASASDLTDLKAFMAQRQRETDREMGVFVDALAECRDRPLLVFGTTPMHWKIVNELRARGIGDGEFHPETLVGGGGGSKGVELPPDQGQDVDRFWGLDQDPSRRMHHIYSSTELGSAVFPMCAAGRYHALPWVATLVLDKAGEQLLNPSPGVGGEVEGRMAFFNTLTDARWGGLLSGDKVKVDFSRCRCGREGPTITEIVRYIDLPEGDDKLTCVGTVDTYVRGVMSE